MLKKPIEQMSVLELRQAQRSALFEANIITRALSLQGEAPALDLVERVNDAHPKGYTEIIVVERA
jgi:hypothetical protein